MTGKPVAYVLFGGDSPVAPELAPLLRTAGIPFFRAAERAMAAIGHYARYGAALARRPEMAATLPAPALPLDAGITIPEWQAKQWLGAAGLPVPPGRLVADGEEAAAAAREIGYPVALKAQSPALSHKSDVGGVVLGIADEPALRQACAHMADRIAAPLDGLLVEPMARAGIELVLSARRDPAWGPMLTIGLGGVWVEALNDVRTFPAALGEQAILTEIQALRGAALLRGWRGGRASDVRAAAATAARLGALMTAVPEIAEIEINPLMVYPEGEGVLVLDALIGIGAAK